jgi:hypothetical protein
MLTWETAVPPSACAIATVVLYGSGVRRFFCYQLNTLNCLMGFQTESNFWFKMFREIIGKLYIISLLITLCVIPSHSVSLPIPADQAANHKNRNSRAYLSELENRDVSLPTLLPAPVTDRSIRTQPRGGNLSFNIAVPVESKHTEDDIPSPEPDEKQPESQ